MLLITNNSGTIKDLIQEKGVKTHAVKRVTRFFLNQLQYFSTT